MFERFTDRSRRVVVLAQEEARMLDHNHIGSEHILLGLLAEAEAIPAQILINNDLTLEVARKAVEALAGRGSTTPSGHIPFTPRSKNVLQGALQESLKLGVNYIAPEHVLLGIIREGESTAVKILVDQGFDLAELRRSVIDECVGAGRVPRPDPDGDGKVRLRVLLPLPATVAANLMLAVGKQWPSAVIGEATDDEASYYGDMLVIEIDP